MITIVKPQSAYLTTDGNADLDLIWETDETEQVAYEILYKRKEKTAWSTTGKTYSKEKSYSLRNLFNYIGQEHLVELHYRVLLYYERKVGEEEVIGTEYSNVYSIIFAPGYTKTLKLYDEEKGTMEFPLFNNTQFKDTKDFNFQLSCMGNWSVPLVPDNHPLASDFHVKTEEGVMSFANNTPTFRDIGVYRNGYFRARAYIMTPLYEYSTYANYKMGYDKTIGYKYYNTYGYMYYETYGSRLYTY